jgi:uncharacterized membrane protein HdeD (DUF308 family)
MLILSGILSVLFGVIMVWNPGAGAIAVAWIIAAYSIMFGIMLVALALRARKMGAGDGPGGGRRAAVG